MDHRISKDMISQGMSVKGEKTTEELNGTQIGKVATPHNMMDAYKSMYEKKEEVAEDAKYGYDKDGNSLNPKDKKKKVKEEVKVEEGLKDFIQKKVDKALTKGTKKLSIGSTNELGSVGSPDSGTYKEEVKAKLVESGKFSEEEIAKILECDSINEEPTTKQLAAREKYAKIKDLTNKGKHVEASALYNKA